MKRLIPVFLAVAMTAPASAQYIWLDKNNVKHYSDQPPPPSVPSSRILKAPRGAPANLTRGTTADESSPASNGASPAAKTQQPMTTAEKNADFNRRRIEQAEKERKAAEEKQRADARAENCARAREYQRALQSGQRITRTGQDGQRAHLSDDERASESQKVDNMLRDCN